MRLVFATRETRIYRAIVSASGSRSATFSTAMFSAYTTRTVLVMDIFADGSLNPRLFDSAEQAWRNNFRGGGEGGGG